MKALFILLFMVHALAAFGQSSTPADTLKIGIPANSADKGFIFDTADGVSNKSLKVEKTSKLLKFDGNSFQIGDGAANVKSLLFNGTSGKKITWDSTLTEFQFNDDVSISAGQKLKTNSIDKTSGSEIALESDTRAKGKLFFGTSGNVQIRENAGNLEFSLDGALYKKVGSGSGGGDGGTPINANISFEDGVTTGWSNTGGTKTQGTYTNGPEGDTKYLSFVASSTGQYFESTAVASSDFMVGGCLAKMDYYSTDASGTFKLQVYDGAANLLKETSLDPKNWQAGYASFPCPTIGTTVKMRVISTAAGTILADRTYLGKENRTFQVAQATYYGSATHSAVSSTSSASYASFVSAVTPTGNVASIPSITGIRIPASAPKGKYQVAYQGTLYSDTASVNQGCFVRMTDATSTATYAETKNLSGISGADIETPFTFVYTYDRTTTGTASDFIIQGKTQGATACYINLSSLVSARFEVTYFPSDSETALRPEAQDWFIDANIGGGNPSLGNVTVSSYTEISNSSLDLVLNTGSAAAKIPCSSTNASTGLTCSSGNEGLGIVFTNPTSGFYKVCSYFTHFLSIGSVTTLYSAFQLVETSPSSQTIVQEGKSRIVSGLSNGGSVLMNQHVPQTNCGTFYFSGVSEKTIRLMSEQIVTGANAVSSFVAADRSAGQGQQDFRITVEPLLSASNRPYLTGDQITSNGAVNPQQEIVHFGLGVNCTSACNTGNCNICSRTGNKIGTVARVSAGTYQLNGIDGTKNICFGAGVESTSGGTVSPLVFDLSNSTSSYARVQNVKSGTGIDVFTATVQCFGVK